MNASAHPLRLTLELERGDGPIRGVLHESGAPTRQFAGWLDLAAELEARRGARRPDIDTDTKGTR
jgi:hypothetical protein